MEIPLTTRIETKRGYLRCVSEEDIDCVWTASRVPGFTDGMLWDPPETKEEIMKSILSTIESWKQGTDIGFSFCLSETNICIGRIAIRETNETDSWNIGYWVHPDYQGQGFATEMLCAVVEFGFATLNADCITSEHATWNEASGKVLQKAGFTFLEHLECGFVKHGKTIPEDRYQITKKEWQAPSRSS